MTDAIFISIATTGFIVAFAHAAIPTHWLPFVLAGRGQSWSKVKTLAVVALCGVGHVGFTTLLGVLVVWLGIEMSQWSSDVFKWIAGCALILFGLFYLARQWRGGGHGHTHGAGHAHQHDGAGHDHDAPANDAHNHASEIKRIETGHGALTLEIFEQGQPPTFRVRAESGATMPSAQALSVETRRADGAAQTFTFEAREGFLQSLENIPEPHEFAATLRFGHSDHDHAHEVRFEEAHGHGLAQEPAGAPKSDGAVILGLFALLTFSPCEGFLPVYLSGVQYGWTGFFMLSAVLAVATVGGMMAFTWLTMSGIERLRLGFLERYESGILGALILFLGVGIIFFGF